MRSGILVLLALAFGAAAGWRSERGEPAGATERPATAERVGEKLAPHELRERCAEVLGGDWRGWAERLHQAETSRELWVLFEELAAATEEEGLASTRLRRTVGRLLGYRWAEVDAAEGARVLAATEKADWALYPLLAEWFLRDREAAHAAMADLKVQGSGDSQVEVLKQLMRRDAKAAIDFMRTTGKYETYVGTGATWHDLARARPQEFASLIVEIESARLEAGEKYRAFSLVRIAAEEYAKRDPDAALAWAEGVAQQRIQSDALQTVLRVWAERDPQHVADLIAKWRRESPDSPRVRASRMTDLWLARGMAEADLDVAAEWLGDAGGTTPQSFAEALAFRVASGERSVEEVFDAVAAVDARNGFAGDAIFREVWGRMGLHELGAAFEVLGDKPAGRARTRAVGGLLRTAMRQDPARAAELLERVPAGAERDELLAETFRDTDLSRRGDEAVEVVIALSAADRPAAVAALFAGEPESEGGRDAFVDHGVLAEALATGPATEHRSGALERLARHWGSQDPVAAMEWAATLPGDEAAAATAAAAHGWASQDEWSLAEHLIEMAPGRRRDAATAVLVESVRESEPRSAWEWTAEIDDSQVRGEARRAVIEGWAGTRPQEARAAVEGAELTNAEREALRTLLPE